MRNTITAKTTTQKRMKRIPLVLWGLALPLMPLIPQTSLGTELHIAEDTQNLPIAMDIEQLPINILASHQHGLELQRISRQGEALRFIDNTEHAWAQGKYTQDQLVTSCAKGDTREVTQKLHTLLYLMEHGWNKHSEGFNPFRMSEFLDLPIKSLSPQQYRYFDHFHKVLINESTMVKALVSHFDLFDYGVLSLPLIAGSLQAIGSRYPDNVWLNSYVPVMLYGMTILGGIYKLPNKIRPIQVCTKLQKRYGGQDAINNELKAAALYAVLKRSAMPGGDVLVSDDCDYDAVEKLIEKECSSWLKELLEGFRSGPDQEFLFCNDSRHPCLQQEPARGGLNP